MFPFPKKCYTKPEWGSVKGIKEKISFSGRKFDKINFHSVAQESGHVND